METIYLTEVTELGPEVPDFLDSGLMILFEAGAPPELAEIAVLHEPVQRREEPPEAGDVVAIGSREFRITAIGEKAWKNIQDLGHAVFKFNGAEEIELPGEIYLEEPGPEGLTDAVQPGTRVEIKVGAAVTAEQRNHA
ncbi:MAG: PTS glucitol/sorbitol transporter subunit IIA [Actinobacteria bacterium]|jgi:PTS system glucitol/sorbitol-specific IIA component|nr:PTS glucitol/sorbitol transporter subunit IIA [Actinomycetota bacterium]MCA1737623.1 PTS glucitol/sorbitol transporter subunit IIA [Actinomycetota bacterium]